MTFHGHFKNGVAVPDQPVDLPDGTPVTIEINRFGDEFWHGKSVDELAREQGVSPQFDASNLGGAWPEDDSIDEFLEFLREVRR